MPSKKKKKPPGSRPSRPSGAAGPSPRASSFHSLQYKVVELSTVDEAALEQTINHWVAQHWHLDGIQFAMREASKRPAMAFVLFTREREADQEELPFSRGPAAEENQVSFLPDRADRARDRLRQLADEEPPTLRNEE